MVIRPENFIFKYSHRVAIRPEKVITKYSQLIVNTFFFNNRAILPYIYPNVNTLYLHTDLRIQYTPTSIHSLVALCLKLEQRADGTRHKGSIAMWQGPRCPDIHPP